MTGIVAVVVLVGVPALAFALWPLLTKRAGQTFLALPPDAREQLLEEKRAVLRALREIEFEHQAGHVSPADYAELRSRYEGEAAAILTALDRLGPAPASAAPAAAAPSRRSGWRHPVAIGATAAALVVFGFALGVGIVRHTEPDRMADVPPPGSRPLATLEPTPGGPAPGDGGRTRTLSPEMLRGMLDAARASLFGGRPQEAVAAYKAVLQRDPDNVDALTHLGVILAMSARDGDAGGLVDHALQLFDRALAVEPGYAPAYFYRGQVLYEARRDVGGAIAAWEKFLAVAPPGEDRDRVARMIAEAKAGRPPK